jgi:LmbE family N-acetylglucosaminyl deacetylase
MKMKRRQFLAALTAARPARAAGEKVVLVIASDAGWFSHAAGTVAKMIGEGATAHLVRIANDEKESWGLSPEETAFRNRTECEAAAKLLGIASVISFGYRASELRDVPHTTMRDRIIALIRHLKPSVMFIPNPHGEHDRSLDSFYAGAAAEDAWHCARFENFLPAVKDSGLPPHLVSEVYYYAPPVDPRRREPESSSTFVPQPVRIDIGAVFPAKLRAVQALKTINRGMARRLKQAMDATGRRLPLVDTVSSTNIDKLVEENLRGLAALSAEGSRYKLAEEFRYAGIEYGIPAAYRR